MTKKANHSRNKAAKKQSPGAEPVIEPVEAVIEAPLEPERRPRKSAKMNRSQLANERIEDEYAYIVGDLRQVFILAAAMFALLIVLNIVFGLVG